MVCLYSDIINKLFCLMFTVLIDQIEHLDNSSIKSYCVGQVYVTNEIIQFSERKLIDKVRCEWSFNAIALAAFMLRRYDAVDHIGYYYSTFLGYKVTLFGHSFICALNKITNSLIELSVV